MEFITRRSAHGVMTAIGIVAVAAPTSAQRAAVRVDLPSQPLGASLRSAAVMTGRNIGVADTLVAGRTAPAVSGTFTAEELLDRLLSGSGLRAEKVAGGFVVVAGGTTEQSERVSRDDSVVVTGTRIRGAAPAGAQVITIDRADIERSGYATTQQLLQALPQNYGGGPNEGSVGVSVRNNTTANSGFGSSVNLRGLGAASTLVLIDGSRPALGGLFGAFSDLSLIPSSAIERIEVLADGASALYGSDAVAGVVNVRLRNDFRGAESRLRYGLADGFDEAQAGQLIGLGWRGGHLAAGYEFYRRGRLGADDRAFAREDLRPFGGPDYRRTFSNPGTILTFDGRTFAIPRGQDGTRLTPGQLVAGSGNLADGRLGTDLLPQTRRHAGYLSLKQDIVPWLSASAQGFLADRRSTTRFIADNYGGVVVTPANPFYVDPTGTRQPYLVNYDFTRDLGRQTASTRVRAVSGVAGLEASLGRWRADLRGSYGVQTERLRSENLPNYVALAAALADPDPRTAFNIFGDGSFTNPATLDRVRGSIRARGRYAMTIATFKADGPLLTLPAGDLKLAVGGEFRRERYAYETLDNQFSATPTVVPTSGLPASRRVLAGFAELLVPVVASAQNVPGIDRLDISVAGRVEDYDSFGTTANPKLGLTWRPVADLSVRASFGRSFRAPGFQETRQGRGTALFLPQSLADPSSPSGTTNALILFGNQPGIGPEKARTWTLGAEYRPAVLPGLSIGATWFDINYRDRIASLQSDYLTFFANRARYGALIDDAPAAATVARFYADPSFSNPFGIAAADIAAIVDARTSNLASSRVEGLDFDLGYRLTANTLDLAAGIAGAYLFRVEQRILPEAPASDVVSTTGNPVDLRFRGRLVAEKGALSAAAFVNYVDGYLNTGIVQPERVRSFTTVDLQFGYTLPRIGSLESLRLTLSASNLFDRQPPYVNNPTVFSATGFDPDNASPVGRLVAVQLVTSW